MTVLSGMMSKGEGTRNLVLSSKAHQRIATLSETVTAVTHLYIELARKSIASGYSTRLAQLVS